MILDLTNPERSPIKYKINNYPDGQSDLQIEVPKDHWDIVNVTINARFNSFKDLELILCATKALRGLRSTHISLYIPYLLGARSDRKFAKGGVSYLRDIVAPIINAQNYRTVSVLDPHSNVAEAVINNLVKIPNYEVVKFAVLDDRPLNSFVLISPDAGAMPKMYDVAKELEYSGDIVIASKHRDIATGKILSTNVPVGPEHQSKDFLIIDDICDGGRTFIEIAKKIKEVLPGDRCGKIYLCVTHGIFSAGFDELSQYFDGIYTTNSVYDQSTNSKGHVAEKLIKQLNVFR